MSRPTLGITSTADRALELSQTAIEHDLEPVVLPCIEIRPAPQEVLEQAQSLAERAQLVLVTSSRALTSLWPQGGMPAVEAAAVGPTAALAVEEAGGSVGVVGAGGAESLVEHLRGRLAGRLVFFPHASGADMTTVQALEEMGAEVASIAVYETRPVAPAAKRVDAAAFGSPSAVLGWSLSRTFDGPVLGAIGTTTAGALADRGHEAHLIAPRPDYELLIALMAKHLTDRSPV